LNQKIFKLIYLMATLTLGTQASWERRLEGADQMTAAQVSYFSDVLCILAYATQARIDAVKEKMH
jgi:hypothetical protein